ncbi:3-ketoacyl-acyl carrier protein reductase (PhaB) [Haloferax mediterranei ATCC 33500]|uniref:3-ketoacyl-acyl carrier protein reductase (PhaB) n=1 Tax=Haloferax mediterranei (strain ATCC 33500 / DSM 1411 / JCM 8866 / NBRC 14739 / NCIMB 2177 / R-4) TaxID=523841 RepID=M0J7Q0_HALMT|nr:3-ketoacyl-acyl carrier protein reductase (PhaB) [Haloferax mediterranei ATCC 33500]
MVNYRTSEAEAYDVVDEIEAAGGSAIALQADVCEYDEVSAMRDRVHKVFGPIDVLVNNAGVTVDCKFENMTCEDWDRVMDVNLGGVFNATKVFYDDLKEADRGRLINISSVVGQQGNFGQANYAATKSGLFGFTRTIALELARHRTTANCVAPGFTQTDMFDDVGEEIQDKICQRIPLNRFAEVDDITGIVRFLASDESDYMTGQVLGVNGGMEW